MTAIIWTQIAKKFMTLRKSGKTRKAALLVIREIYGCSSRTVYRCLIRERRREKEASKFCAKLSQHSDRQKKRGLLN